MKLVERIHNLETNEIIDIERDATPEELKEIELAQAEAAAIKAELEAKAKAKADLLAKLGITQEEAKLLLS
jgi:hypothetical protein